MIDYRAHLVGLAECIDKLGTVSDPDIANARDRQLHDVNKNKGAVALGALVDQLFWHAASDGTELELVQRAAELWVKGLNVYAAITEARAGMEAGLANPADPKSPARLATAFATLKKLSADANALRKDIFEVRDAALGFGHLPEHPREQDKPADIWDWGNLLVGRRTDAFVRNLHSAAEGDATTRAFSFGVLSSYSSNACGSGYLGQVVGGPRRSHRFRDRVARNSIGSWFAEHHPEVVSLGAIGELVSLGNGPAPALPTSVLNVLQHAISLTYGGGQTAPVPDLQLGYDRMVRHLRLLDTFKMPPPPAMPSEPFATQLFGRKTTPPIITWQEASDYPVDNDGVVPQTYPPPSNYGGNSAPAPADSAPNALERCGLGLLAILRGIVFLVGGWGACLIFWWDNKRCPFWEDAGLDWAKANQATQAQKEAAISRASSPLTTSEVVATVETGPMASVVGNLFSLQCAAWEWLDQALVALMKTGLIYPDGRLALPSFASFVTANAPDPAWPRRPEPDPRSTFHDYPASPPEAPSQVGQSYPVGTHPDVFVAPGPANGGLPTATDVALFVWKQIARGQLDSTNYDLDADRGLSHPCWRTNGSINNDPVGVDVLSYEAMD